MKIGFYIDNKNLSNLDISFLENGNPGIGGSEYMIISLINQLSKKHKIVLFSHKKIIIKNTSNVIFTEIKNIFIHADKYSVDFLIIKYIRDISIFEHRFNPKNINFILWAHNIIPNYQLSILSKNNNLSALVCVSKEQQDLFRDNSIFYKSTYIFNGIHNSQIESDLPFYNDRNNEVTYIGSLVPEKGFHVLAKAWPKVLKRVPDAKLNVIGSGRLYNKTSKLGSYKIADENYEKLFMPYLIDNRGEIIDSVKFWGILGKEKNNILKQTKVGIPNPSGFTETFCLSAVEMQLLGCHVITKKYVGLLDTVLSPSKLLSNTNRNLHNEIINALISKNEYNISLIQKHLLNKFSFKIIIKEWENLFKKIQSNEHINDDFNFKNGSYNLKWLRELNRIVKKLIPFGQKLPEIDFYLLIIGKFFKIKNLIKY
jgi:glycosyltransferase involved in cell wall biosynthesis